MRGIAAEHEGRVLGVSGVMYSTPMQAFSTMLPEMQEHPMAIRSAIREMRRILVEHGSVVFAIPDEKYQNSRRVLELTGFKPFHNTRYMAYG